MKRMVSFVLCGILCLPVSATAAGLEEWPARPASRSIQATRTVVHAEGLCFISCAELEYRLGIPAGALKGLTLTRLPNRAEGELTLDGVEAPLYERLTCAEIDRLVYEPADVYVTGRIGFIPEYGSGRAVTLDIAAVEDPVEVPQIWGGAVFTLTDMPYSGTIAASDQFGEQPDLKLIEAPRKGEVQLYDDRYVYTPDEGVSGNDKFTIVAVDSRGVYSQSYTVDVTIQNYSGIRFADLEDSPYAAEATMAAHLGLIGGRQVGAIHCFDPGDTLTGAQFVAAVMAAVGDAAGKPADALPVGLWPRKSGALPVLYREVIMRAAACGYVNSYSFDAGRAVTTAEAATILSRAAGTVSGAVNRLPDHVAELPVSALPAYMALTSAGLLPDGPRPGPDEVLTRDYAAAMVYRLYRHYH